MMMITPRSDMFTLPTELKTAQIIYPSDVDLNSDKVLPEPFYPKTTSIEPNNTIS